MRKILLSLVLSILLLGFGFSALAVIDADIELIPEEDYGPMLDMEWDDYEMEMDYELDHEMHYENEMPADFPEEFDYQALMEGFMQEAGLDQEDSLPFGLGFMASPFSIIIFLIIYVYMALAYIALAKKTQTTPAWLAWVPIANFYLVSKMARMHWWPILLLIAGLIPILGIVAAIAFMVFAIIWHWKIFERVNRPGWWAVLVVIPVVGAFIFYVLLGIAAWGKPAKKPVDKAPHASSGPESPSH